jgi:hypothetical protein
MWGGVVPDRTAKPKALRGEHRGTTVALCVGMRDRLRSFSQHHWLLGLTAFAAFVPLWLLVAGEPVAYG